MRIRGQHTLRAAREEVWRTLLDPEALRRCVPGCERMEIVGPDLYAAAIVVDTVLLRGTYQGTIRLSEVEPCSSFRVVVEGAGAAGKIRGEGTIELRDPEEVNRPGVGPTPTVVSFAGDLRLPGLLSLLGDRLVAPIVADLSGRFFRCLEAQCGR